jgi:hypothetical protein
MTPSSSQVLLYLGARNKKEALNRLFAVFGAEDRCALTAAAQYCAKKKRQHVRFRWLSSFSSKALPILPVEVTVEPEGAISSANWKVTLTPFEIADPDTSRNDKNSMYALLFHSD